MSEVTLYECDVTGERYGAKNDVYEYEIKKRRANSPFDSYKRTIHLANEAFEPTDLKTHYHVPSPSKVHYIGVNDGEVVGILIDINGSAHWKERDDVVVESHVPFFKFLEEEVLYG